MTANGQAPSSGWLLNRVTTYSAEQTEIGADQIATLASTLAAWAIDPETVDVLVRRVGAVSKFGVDAIDDAALFDPGRVVLVLEPGRVKRLVEVLRSAGAHPSGLGSYEAANDASALADEIEAMSGLTEGRD